MADYIISKCPITSQRADHKQLGESSTKANTPSCLRAEHRQGVDAGSVGMRLAKRLVVGEKLFERHRLEVVHVDARVEHSRTAHDELPVVVADVVVDVAVDQPVMILDSASSGWRQAA